MVTRTDGINTSTISTSRSWESHGRKGPRPRSPFNAVSLEMLNCWPDARPVYSEAIQLVPDELVDYARIKAFDRFKTDLMASSQVASSLAEGRQSLSMISQRSEQILRFTRALARGRVNDAVKALEIDKVPKGFKLKGKSLGDKFLEFHFGWEPLVKDIGDSVEVLQGSINPVTVRGRGTAHRDYNYRDSTIPQGYGRIDSGRYRARVQFLAEVKVVNPNLLLANQLGFVNPASVAWELTTLSFVVDWFSNVSQFLDSLTAFVGLQLMQPATTITRNSVTTRAYYGIWGDAYGDTVERKEFSRTLAVPSVNLSLRDPKQLSPTRGLTAISLLLQQLR